MNNSLNYHFNFIFFKIEVRGGTWGNKSQIREHGGIALVVANNRELGAIALKMLGHALGVVANNRELGDNWEFLIFFKDEIL